MLKTIWADIIEKNSRPIEDNYDPNMLEIGSGKTINWQPGTIEVLADITNSGRREHFLRGDVLLGDKVNISNDDYLILYKERENLGDDKGSHFREEYISYVLWRNIKNLKFYFPKID